MDEKNKKEFDQWLQANYPELYKQFTDTDSLHDAYILVTQLHKVERNRFNDTIARAYLLRRRQQIHYLCTFIFPEPLFWLYQAMEEYDELISEEQKVAQKEKEQTEKRKQQALHNFAKWVHRNYPPNEYNIFRLFYIEKLTNQEIVRLTGLSKNTISHIINTMCNEYKQHKNNK